jgi:LPXTG-site transpeptidase (sortase) family protein
VPSKSVQHTAPALKPISKTLGDITPSPQLSIQPAAEVTPPVTVEPVAAPQVKKLTFEPPVTPVVAIKKRKHLSLRKKPAKHHVLHGMAALLFVAGMYVAVYGWFANRAIEQQASVLGAQVQRERPAVGSAVGSDRGVLSERLPIGIGGYSVGSDLPRVSHIPSLKVVAPVLHLDANRDGSLAATKNIYETGWYKASALPSDKEGAIVINGHVSGPTKHGVFYGLKDLKAGQEIVLERGDRRMITFVVKEVAAVKADKVDMKKLVKSSEPGKLGLNLITSHNENDTDKPHIIVYAVQK